MAGEALDKQELRIALVMNGGVSLAVWMGGVTRELDRVRLAQKGSVYAELLELTASTTRIDVIAGASAGGINGAVLALAIARGAKVDAIRGLWMNNGAIEELLRNPLEKDALSLLKGDAHLLACLSAAMDQIAASGSGGDVHAPLDLTVTGTTLVGEVRGYADLYGAVIPDVDHRGRFRFRRTPDHPVDDFGSAAAPAQLALAARSSASFPGAFEPSFIPVGAEGKTDKPAGSDLLHPDMRGVANFGESRWVIDGGVLVNTPFRPALDAIAALRADGSVRRVLGYVVPNLVVRDTKPDDRTATHSALAVAADALSRLPRVQSIGRELEEIEASNDEVRRRRLTREETLVHLDAATLEAAAARLLPAYVRIRAHGAAEQIVAILLGGRHEREPTADQVAAVRRKVPTVADSPWAPRAPRENAPEPWERIELSPWRWGFAPVQHMGNVALQLVRRALQTAEAEAARALAESGERSFDELRTRVHNALADLRRIDRGSRDFWTVTAGDVFADPGELDRLAPEWERRFAGDLLKVARSLAAVLIDLHRLVSGLLPGSRVLSMLETLVDPSTAPPSNDTTVRRLLALDVFQRTTGADLGGIEQAVELVLMSADTPCAIDASARSHAEDKLAGLQVGHFGGFYKKSWRANDWMWGRLDGADRLVRTLLDADRIRLRFRRGDSVEQILGEIETIAVGPAGEHQGWLRANAWDEPTEGAVRAQLEELHRLDSAALGRPDDPAPTPPGALSKAHEAISKRVQLGILADEIPNVRKAAVDDVSARASSRSSGAQWAKSLPDRKLADNELVDALADCFVGKETIGAEVGSDHFTDVVTRAGAVAGSVVSGSVPKPDVPLLKKLVPFAVGWIRGVFLVLYLLGRGVLEASLTGSFLAALVLGTGGALVALLAVGVDVPGLLWVPALWLLLAGLLLGALRQLWLRIVLVVVAFVATAAGFWVIDAWSGRPDWVDSTAPVAAVTLMALAPMFLALAGGKSQSPSDRAASRRSRGRPREDT